MRQENYLIALFTKDLLDLRVRLPCPPALQRYVPQKMITFDEVTETAYLTFGENNLTKALEWNLRYCLLGFLFDERGRVRKAFVKERGRQGMIESYVFCPTIVFVLISHQSATPLHVHGYPKCRLFTIHCPVPPHVQLFPLLRGKLCVTSVR
jgi:hypothetical protein